MTVTLIILGVLLVVGCTAVGVWYAWRYLLRDTPYRATLKRIWEAQDRDGE